MRQTSIAERRVFIRSRGGTVDSVEACRFGDGSAYLSGCLERIYEGGPDCWHRALTFLEEEGFTAQASESAQPGAAPNGGPAEPFGNSGLGGGPPSVS